ncbi:hypothetical protein K469DRAFT_641330 [Zopfia rhizophila CBS 207.26]|uniref:Rhodopsin domain-containing protein n=1 Tax=Zopfia rhizophila CBS 207.26 TaxID=1314779 RepID=A0A6A6DJY7_9PEZI|nr:hypothetical protein K469DRAFT_641330 [Zopfia rhizophila CBS 207.26]
MSIPPAKLEAILNGPAAHPPPGEESNLLNPPSLAASGIATAAIFLTLATAGVVVRMYTKWKIVRKMVLEDWLLIVAWVIYAGGFNTMVFMMGHEKIGEHQWNVRLKDFIYQQKLLYIATILYGCSVIPLKIAIILQEIRVFVPYGIRDFTFWAGHILIWVNTAFYVACTFVELFGCSPRQKFWDPLIQGGYCVDTLTIHIVSSSFNAASDILILILPQRVIWTLNLTKKRKWGLSAVFLIGIFACLSAVLRLYYSVKLSKTEDISYVGSMMGAMSLPELGFGFLVACLPVTPKFVKFAMNTRLGTTLRSLLRSSGSRSETGSGAVNENGTIGSNGKKFAQVTDIEFHQLVRTDKSNTSMASYEDESTGKPMWVPKKPETVHRGKDEEWAR